MPHDTTGPTAGHETRDATPSPRPAAWTARVVGLALVLTLAALITLVGLKVATSAGWRADTSGSLRVCLQQQSPPSARTRLPNSGHLADCLARHQPIRHDPIELVILAGLTVLAAAEIGYLTRHR